MDGDIPLQSSEQPKQQEIEQLSDELTTDSDSILELPTAVLNQLKNVRQQMSDRGHELPVMPTTVDDALKQVRDIREELKK
ncbi:MAG: hypothetical protein GKR90_25395 [Pseudomonadales bacterium]|nr:hypothetical protein [Pseudomonadales bacterium]